MVAAFRERSPTARRSPKDVYFIALFPTNCYYALWAYKIFEEISDVSYSHRPRVAGNANLLGTEARGFNY